MVINFIFNLKKNNFLYIFYSFLEITMTKSPAFKTLKIIII